MTSQPCTKQLCGGSTRHSACPSGVCVGTGGPGICVGTGGPQHPSCLPSPGPIMASRATGSGLPCGVGPRVVWWCPLFCQ